MTTPPSTDAAQHCAVAQIQWPDGTVRGARVRLEYVATDAAALTMTVACTPPGTAQSVASSWLFARDMLTAVVAEDTVAGAGDVIVARHNHDWLRFCLHRGNVTVDVLLPLFDMARFIAETERRCPQGSIEETARLSQQIDAALVEILRGAR